MSDPRVIAAGLVPYHAPEVNSPLIPQYRRVGETLWDLERVPGQFHLFLVHEDPGVYDSLRPLLIQLESELAMGGANP